MNAKEAKDIIYARNPIQSENDYLQAKGYLSALEGKEVSMLIKGFEEILFRADDIEYETEQEFRKIICQYQDMVYK